MKKALLACLFTGLAGSLFSTPALADGREAGSLLVYPIFDSTPGVASMITITNTHPTEGVYVEYRYINAGTCLKDDRCEYLTPLDTLTVVASAHHANNSVGYLYVFAKDSCVGSPISFNYLVGQASLFNGVDVLQVSYNAYPFYAIPDDGALTDLDGDEILDLDGHEYEMAPDVMIHPRFIGQASQSAPGFDSSLVLINLTGGTQFTAEVGFLIYNDNEVQFSASLSFHCWATINLNLISGAFLTEFLRENGDNDDEIIGLPEFESGWFTVDGIVANSSATSIDDPAILTLLIDTTGNVFGGADLPFQRGKQDNGDLLPRGVLGDS